MEFDEDIFIWSLTTRPEDCRRFMQVFNPTWLTKSEYQPLLANIFTFTKKHGEPPSLPTLRKLFEDEDPEAYKLRYKKVIDKIQELGEPDRSAILYTLDKVRDVSIVRSFEEMNRKQSFLTKTEDIDGKALLLDIHTWYNKFSASSDDKTLNIKDAIEGLLDTSSFIKEREKIPCGIKCIDEWCGGGLKPKQLGIIMAPTGEGKTATMTVMSHKVATIEMKRAWYITNEETINDATEKYLSRMVRTTTLDDIMEDPSIVVGEVDRHWEDKLQDRLWITEINREASTDDIEAEMVKFVNLYGWKPDVIFLDYMERMKPNHARGTDEWHWIQSIAQDLCRFARRHNILIWTACQLNRSGIQAARKGDSIGLYHGQGSIRHFQEAAAVISLHQKDLEEPYVALTYESHKLRRSRKPARPVTVKANLSKMYISDERIEDEIEEDEDTTLVDRQNKMKNKGKI